jgi:hypothetical protein
MTTSTTPTCENGVPEKQTGYCTDVWFREATNFIEKHKEKPFFCYVATNARTGRTTSMKSTPSCYLDKGVPQPMANFYGMIANIDENIGRLLGKLDEWKLADNTIVVFMTDNGSAMGVLPAKTWVNGGQMARLQRRICGDRRDRSMREASCAVLYSRSIFQSRNRARSILFSRHTLDLLPTLIGIVD